jgi:hypothetical protein
MKRGSLTTTNFQIINYYIVRLDRWLRQPNNYQPPTIN